MAAMTLDNALDQLGAVRRDVETRDHEGRPARVLVAEQTYPTSAEDLWDALTNPARLPRWFLPVEGDLQVGGRYQLVGNAGGTIERCEAPSSLAVTWEYGEETTWVVVTLTEADDRTTLLLEHIAHVDEDRWRQYGPGAVGVGWDLALIGLAEHLTTGAAVDPEAAAAWGMTTEGVAFIERVSEAWADASAAAGTDPAEARLAGRRTTAFYTGQPEPEA
jgi:uncharacterized protein YndB with AHSA1/START domain